MGKSNQVFLRIPNMFVRNEGVSLSALDFTLLCVLKHKSFLTGKPSFDVDTFKVRKVLDVSDVRTFKKSLLNLKESGVINGDFIKLPRNGPLQIQLSDSVISGTPFTRLPVGVLNRIEQIGHVGLRLLFYYESHINRGTLKKQFCYSSYKTISERLSISEPTIWKYNEILERNNLLEIQRSALSTDYSYKTIDATTEQLVFTKYNNHYLPSVEKM